jgi:hypothetical protein
MTPAFSIRTPQTSGNALRKEGDTRSKISEDEQNWPLASLRTMLKVLRYFVPDSGMLGVRSLPRPLRSPPRLVKPALVIA